MGGMGGWGMGGSRKRGRSRQPEKAPMVVRDLGCTLEELYNGKQKRLKITRNIADASGKTMTASKVLVVDVKPGYKAGTKITFPEEGDEAPGIIPADIRFVIREKPHSTYKRLGDALETTGTVSLADALTKNVRFSLTTLDGRTITVAPDVVITPSTRWRVEGEGMPRRKKDGGPSHGDLIVKFDVAYPIDHLNSLSSGQQTQLRSLLS